MVAEDRMELPWRVASRLKSAGALAPLSSKQILSSLALLSSIAGCTDRSVDIVEPSQVEGTAIAMQLRGERHRSMRDIGEGCAVVGRDSGGTLRTFAVKRGQLPFQLPKIERDPDTRRGNGVIAHVTITPFAGPPMWLSCWVPKTFGPEALANAVGDARNDERWEYFVSRLQHARELPAPHERAPISPEGRAFALELLEADTTRARDDMGRRTPQSRTNNLAADGWGFVCDWGWVDFYWEVTGFGVDCSYGGYGWEIYVGVVIYFLDWEDAYLWLIDNGYYQPYNWCGNLELNHIIWQYDNPNLYDSTKFGGTEGPGTMPQSQRASAHWKPTCNEFTSYTTSIFFDWPQLKEHTSAAWAVIKQPLTVDTSAHWGLDYWRLRYGSLRNINSAYRTPRHNLSPEVGSTAKGSPHVRGVAVDLRNESRTEAEWNNMESAARDAQASWVEPRTGECGIGCVHADWRWWVHWPH